MILVSARYLTIGLGAAERRAVAPLDDAYITYQYARQIAQGHPYQYNDGDPATTGMTSPLFGLLLAGAHRIGFTDEWLVALAVCLGSLYIGLIGWITYRLAFHLTESQRWALFGSLLVILSGSVQWGSFNGMETGLFTVLTLAALYAFLAQRDKLCVVSLGLATLVRTEGLILAGSVWAASVADGFLGKGAERWKRPQILSGALVVALVPYVINWAFTGDPSAAGLRAKSWFLNVPFYPGDIIRSALRCYRTIILGYFLGGRQWLVPPGMLLLALLGWFALGMRRQWMALSVTMSWFLVGTLSTATLITATWHMGRYQVPFVPVVAVLAVCGLNTLEKRLRGRWKPIILGALGLFLLATSTYSTVNAARVYQRAADTVAQQQLRLADWLRQNLPAGARTGVHDAGSLRYVGERPTYDLIGLTTPHAAAAWRSGAGSVFEMMEHSPMRPDYFAIYPDVFSIPYLRETDLFAEELFRVEVPEYAVASAGPVQGVWRADWHLAGSGERLYQADILERTQGLTLMDTVDVADLDDEAVHSVEWWQNVKHPGFPTEVWQLAYRVPPHDEVLDGGRLLTGGIAFDTRTRPGKDLWIVARLHAQQRGSVRIEIDGEPSGYWAYPSVPGQWLETMFRVPAARINTETTRVALNVETDDSAFHHFSPYAFWVFQGETGEIDPSIEKRTEVTFGDSLSLLGIDPPEARLHPGDVLHVALYWQAQSRTNEDAKVFLHLYDASDSLGPQSDGWAVHGTRPPYTWVPGEIVEDRRTLRLPDDLPPGEYSLELGLYSPDGSGRLSAYREDIPQAEGRVTLATIGVME
jgi:hypothetical protein